jgi:nucleoid-associated protein YgaU
VGASSTERQREIERAMRAHPAGRARRAREAGGRPAVPAPAPARAAGGAPVAPLRLTARGKVVGAVLLLAVATGGAAVTGLLPGSGGGAGGLHLEGQSSVVVRPGDTLWSIASSVAGDDDVRDVVAGIRQVNGLRGTALVPGEVLRVP